MNKNLLLDKFNSIEDKICEACHKSNRAREEIKLIAVSKKQPIESLKIYEQWCHDKHRIPIFGENYVQEIIEKRELLERSSLIHLIGPLQSNKIKKVVPAINCIQSVSSLTLASNLNQECKKGERILDIFLQINISNDDHKNGFELNDIKENYEKIKILSNLRIVGLMTITRLYENKLDVIPDFMRLKKLGLELDSTLEISMGMSSDFDIAIANGATIVRIGTNLFGDRQ